MRGMFVGRSRGRLYDVFGSRGIVYLCEAIYAVGAFLPAVKRVGFAVPEASGGVEAAREDRLLGGSMLRTVRHTQPLPGAGALQQVSDKRGSIAARRDIEMNGLQKVFRVL